MSPWDICARCKPELNFFQDFSGAIEFLRLCENYFEGINQYVDCGDRCLCFVMLIFTMEDQHV